MTKIEVKKIVKALDTSDGAGVKLKRSIGTPEADYIDPFLMLDEFGSENKDDYIAGFPPETSQVLALKKVISEEFILYFFTGMS